eukprot:5793608-Amphidinium_carterae.1
MLTVRYQDGRRFGCAKARNLRPNAMLQAFIHFIALLVLNVGSGPVVYTVGIVRPFLPWIRQ